MKIHHLRNATFVIESGDHFILVDPMLSEKGQLPPFSFFRHKARRNPTVSLPKNADELLGKITHCLLTHCQKLGLKMLRHVDHLDGRGESFLRENKIPLTCHEQDAKFLEKAGIVVEKTLRYWKAQPFLGGEITAVPAQHGYTWIRHFMANGAGFHVQLPAEPSIYISGDTVYTIKVEKALIQFQPDIAVVAAGGARLDLGGPILMPLDEVLSFIQTAPKKVMVNHLEALNHCPITRKKLKRKLDRRGLRSKTFIPKDGETIAHRAVDASESVAQS